MKEHRRPQRSLHRFIILKHILSRHIYSDINFMLLNACPRREQEWATISWGIFSWHWKEKALLLYLSRYRYVHFSTHLTNSGSLENIVTEISAKYWLWESGFRMVYFHKRADIYHSNKSLISPIFIVIGKYYCKVYLLQKCVLRYLGQNKLETNYFINHITMNIVRAS